MVIDSTKRSFRFRKSEALHGFSWRETIFYTNNIENVYLGVRAIFTGGFGCCFSGCLGTDLGIWGSVFGMVWVLLGG